MNFKSVLQNAGWNSNGKLLANVMPWVGEPTHVHRCSSYNSNNPFAVARQITNLKAAGFDGVILTWRGVQVAGGFDQVTALQLAYQCSNAGMLFAYMLDPGILKWRTDPSTTPYETTLINNFNDPGVQQVLNCGAYLPEGYVFDFLTGYSINWATVQAGVTGAQKIVGIKRNADYTWACLIDIPSLAAQHASTAIKVPSVAYGLNDAGCPLPYGATLATYNGTRDYSQSVWSTAPNSQLARVNDTQGGKYFMDCVQSIIASPTAKAAKYVSLVTWNDYDERTAVEDMIVGMTGVRIGN